MKAKHIRNAAYGEKNRSGLCSSSLNVIWTVKKMHWIKKIK